MARKKKTKETPLEAINEKPATQTVAETQTEKLVAKQTHGQKVNKRGARSLYELLGEKHNIYDQKTEAEYEAFLNSMNLTDLEVHASQVGVIPKEDRHQTIANLLRNFRLVSSDYYNTVEVQPVKFKVSKKVIDILSEGR